MLAIIIPYFKIDFFEKTLNSLANQTNKNFTVYVADDASPNDIEDLIKSFEGVLSISYTKFSNNLGGKSLVKQWERCLQLVSNEQWVTFLGDDDYYDINIVADFYKNIDQINQHKSKVVRFATSVVNENGNSISNVFLHPKVETDVKFLNRKFSKKTRSSLSEHFFNLEELQKVGFIDLPLAWHSDDLAVLAVSKGNVIFSINSSKVYVRVSTVSITGKNDNTALKAKATLDFFFLYINNKYKLDLDTFEKFTRKLEYSFVQSKSNKYLFSILILYVSKFEVKKIIRLIYIYINKNLK